MGTDLTDAAATSDTRRKLIVRAFRELPVYRWTWRGPRRGIHIGPTAQDFHAAFDVGAGARSIDYRDAFGISVVVIQELHDRIDALENAIVELRSAAAPAAHDRVGPGFDP